MENWRYELSYVLPEIWVLCKGNDWVKLLKPKKHFEASIRSILITIHCSHFVKKNPEATKNTIWYHLSRVFSTYEVAPSEVECMNHIILIRKAAERDRDLMKSENDFNFERRDWLNVQPRELPEGSQLIMGLNPPFRYKASLANKFINKALQFQPRLLILIVPPETQRLDSRTDKKYDLIRDDPYLLSGESFYLPGSCDTQDKQVSQWNKITPLHLWSHPDWTSRHKYIASMCGQSQLSNQLPCPQQPTWNYLLKEQQDYYGDFSNLMNEYGDLPHMLDDVPEPNENHELSEHKFEG